MCGYGKAIRKTHAWIQRNPPILEIISADLGTPFAIYETDLKPALREYSEAFFYTAKSIGRFAGYSFSKEWNAFLTNYSPEQANKIQPVFLDLPKYFSEDDLVEVTRNHCLSEVENDYLRFLIDKTYVYIKGFYFQRKIGLGDKCAFILQYFYPDGIHIYGEKEYLKFISLLKDYFGESEQLMSHRSMIANVMRVVACSSDFRHIQDLRSSHILDSLSPF